MMLRDFVLVSASMMQQSFPAGAIMTIADPTTASDIASIEPQVADFKARYQAIESEIGKVIVGHKDVVAQTVLCLMIGVPRSSRRRPRPG